MVSYRSLLAVFAAAQYVYSLPLHSSSHLEPTERGLTDYSRLVRRTNHKCQHCPRSFRSPEERDKHQGTPHAPPLIKCGKCDAWFESQKGLTSHMSSPVHNLRSKKLNPKPSTNQGTKQPGSSSLQNVGPALAPAPPREATGRTGSQGATHPPPITYKPDVRGPLCQPPQAQPVQQSGYHVPQQQPAAVPQNAPPAAPQGFSAQQSGTAAQGQPLQSNQQPQAKYINLQTDTVWYDSD